ncbi:MAG: hypothetical protein JKX84_01025 [Flavobacteriales bacterium]|nr:hypothetical protein [Flavobacteriales bacterium]
MKRISFTLMAVVMLSVMSFAQQAELKSAVVNLDKKDYMAAMDDIKKAQKMVTSMMGEQLAAVLPQKFGEYEMQSAEDGGMGMGMEGQGMSVYKIYKKPQTENEAEESSAEGEMSDPASIDPAGMDPAAMDPAGMDPMMGMGMPEEITVQITTDMMMASEVQMAHSGSDGGMMGDMKAIRIKGYRAVVRSQSDGMSGDVGGGSQEAMATVGGAFITVRTQGVKEEGQAERLLNLIDFDKLKTIVGE